MAWYLPMQYFLSWLWINPGLQRQKNPPTVFTQPPFSQTVSSSHSFLSSHLLVWGFLAWPEGHSQVKEPTLFTHCPPEQRWGIASHSLISKRKCTHFMTMLNKMIIFYLPTHSPVFWFFKNPVSHSNLDGQCSQGWPHAFPTVAQHSVLVHTTPSSWLTQSGPRIPV